MCLVLQLDLSQNSLCGLYYNDYGELRGTYTADGIMALSEALKVTGSLTRLDVRGNYSDSWGGNGVQLLRDAVREREGFVLIDDHNDFLEH